MIEELIITEENFEEYFFDVRRNKIKHGQVMASYRAKASFINTPMKWDIIDLLKKDKAFAATRVMRNFHSAVELDAIRVPKQMANDLISGMSESEVADKDYEMTVEYFYYTDRENIPDDPHWSCISVRNLNEFVTTMDDGSTIKSKIVIPEGFEWPEDEEFDEMLKKVVTQEEHKDEGEDFD